jgi:hypothetical protein
VEYGCGRDLDRLVVAIDTDSITVSLSTDTVAALDGA